MEQEDCLRVKSYLGENRWEVKGMKIKCEKCKKPASSKNVDVVKNIANVVHYAWRCTCCGETNYVEKI